MKNVLFVTLIAAAVASCATLQAATTRSTEDVLSAAGFSIETVDTADKLAQPERLPARQVVRDVRDGKTVYVYRDPSVCRCAHIGAKPQYQAYKRLQVEKDIADEEARADMTSPWGWATGCGPWGIVSPGPYRP